jgi:hypothetical protein
MSYAERGLESRSHTPYAPLIGGFSEELSIKLKRAINAIGYVGEFGVPDDSSSFLNFRGIVQQHDDGGYFLRNRDGATRIAGTDFW